MTAYMNSSCFLKREHVIVCEFELNWILSGKLGLHMKNRAKCKLCQSVIESFHVSDYVSCSCGEISIDGGDQYCHALAKNWENFLRIDDEDNEITVKVMDKSLDDTEETSDVKPLYTEKKPSRADLIQMLDEMSKSIENLPHQAMTMTVSNYDLGALISLLTLIFKSETS